MGRRRYLLTVLLLILSALSVSRSLAQEPETRGLESVRLENTSPYVHNDDRYQTKFDVVRDGKVDVQDIMAVANSWHGQADVSMQDRVWVDDWWISSDGETVWGYVNNGLPLSLEDPEIAARFYDADGQLVASNKGNFVFMYIPSFSRAWFPIRFYEPIPDYASAEVVLTDVDVAPEESIEINVLHVERTGWGWKVDVQNDMNYSISWPSMHCYILDDSGRVDGIESDIISVIDQENYLMRPGEESEVEISDYRLDELILENCWFEGDIYVGDRLGGG